MTTLRQIAEALHDHDKIAAPGTTSDQWDQFVAEVHRFWGFTPSPYDVDQDFEVDDEFATFWLAVARSDYDTAEQYGEVPEDWRLYPVVVVAGHGTPPELEPVTELGPVATLEDAKQSATDHGYRVIDEGEGGSCETTNAWDPERGTVHVVTVEL